MKILSIDCLLKVWDIAVLLDPVVVIRNADVHSRTFRGAALADAETDDSNLNSAR